MKRAQLWQNVAIVIAIKGRFDNNLNIEIFLGSELVGAFSIISFSSDDDIFGCSFG